MHEIKVEIKGNNIIDQAINKIYQENAEKNFGQGYVMMKNTDTGVTLPVFSEFRINEIIQQGNFKIENNKK